MLVKVKNKKPFPSAKTTSDNPDFYQTDTNNLCHNLNDVQSYLDVSQRKIKKKFFLSLPQIQVQIQPVLFCTFRSQAL